MIDLATPPVPLLGFVAASGTGKTTLLKALIPLLKDQGLRIGVIKHSHHAFAIDHPGKDSYELRIAGANSVMLSSATRRALIMEWPDHREPDLAAELDLFPLQNLDLVLIEGFKHAPIAKIEVHRPSLGNRPLFPDDDRIVAIATDRSLRPPAPVPELDLNQPKLIARYIQDVHLSRCEP